MWGLIAGLIGAGISYYGGENSKRAAYNQFKQAQLAAAQSKAQYEAIGRDVLLALGVGLTLWSMFEFAFEE